MAFAGNSIPILRGRSSAPWCISSLPRRYEFQSSDLMSHARHCKLKRNKSTGASANQEHVVKSYNNTCVRQHQQVEADCAPMSMAGTGPGGYKKWTPSSCLKVCFPKPQWCLETLDKFASRANGLPAARRTASMAASSHMLAETADDASHGHIKNIRCAMSETARELIVERHSIQKL